MIIFSNVGTGTEIDPEDRTVYSILDNNNSYYLHLM